jgi:Lysozyme like domain
MNQSQIYTLAKGAGLSDARAKIAAAIAMAESGGNEGAHTVDSDDDSYGLWQINYKGDLKGPRTAQFGPGSVLLDPKANAKAMSTISHQGQNFTPWTTYTSGKYKQFLGNTVSEVDTTPAAGTDLFSNPLGSISDTVTAARTVASIVVKGSEWVSNPSNWVRVVYVIGGTVAVIAGLVTVVKSTEVGTAVVRTGKKVVATGTKVAGTTAKVAAL